MKQQFTGLFHCKCGTSWRRDIGFFDFKGDHADGIDALVDQLDKLDEEQIQALTAFIKTIVK